MDIYDTQKALHQAINMPEEEKNNKIEILRRLIEEEDINFWLKSQMDFLNSISGKKGRKSFFE